MLNKCYLAGIWVAGYSGWYRAFQNPCNSHSWPH